MNRPVRPRDGDLYKLDEGILLPEGNAVVVLREASPILGKTVWFCAIPSNWVSDYECLLYQFNLDCYSHFEVLCDS